MSSKNTKNVEDTQHDICAIVVVPDGLEISQFEATRTADKNELNPILETLNYAHQYTSTDHSELLTRTTYPLCCLELPFGFSLLARNLNNLRKAGVSDIFIVTSEQYTHVIEEYLQKNCRHRKFKSIRVLSVSSHTIGEALREVRASELRELQSDFFLIMADTFMPSGKNDLTQCLITHRHGVLHNQNRILTRFITQVPKELPCDIQKLRHPYPDSMSLLVNKANGDLLQYNGLESDNTVSYFNITADMIGATPGNRILSLLIKPIESGIDVCTPHVLDILDEQFDCVHIFPDFVLRIITDELKLKSIGIYLSESNSHLLCPNACRILSVDHLYLIMRLFLQFPSIIAKECHVVDSKRPDLLERPLHLFSTNFIHENSSTTINDNVILINTFIGRNVTIESGCSIKNCIIFNDVCIGKGTVCQDCVFYPTCSIPSNTILRQTTICSNVQTLPLNISEKCLILDDSTFQSHHLLAGIDLQRLDYTTHTHLPLINMAEYLDENMTDTQTYSKNGSSFQESSSTDKSDTEEEEEDNDFFPEVYSLSLEGLKTPKFLDHKLLEIKSFRLACNRRLRECIAPCVKAFIDFLSELPLPLTVDVLESVRVTNLFETFVLFNDQTTQFVFLKYLLEYSYRKIVILNVDGESSDSEDQSHPFQSDIQQLENPYYAKSEFLILFRLILNLEFINNSTVVDWYLRHSELPHDISVNPEAFNHFMHHGEMEAFLQECINAEQE